MKKLLISIVSLICDLIFIGVIVWGVCSVPDKIRKITSEKRIEKRVKNINKESHKILLDAIHDIDIINFPVIGKGKVIDSIDAIYNDIDTVIFPMIGKGRDSLCIDIAKIVETYIAIDADSAELGLQYANVLKTSAEELKDSLIKHDSLMNGKNWKLLKRLDQNK
jgi:hypothetical protein